MATVANQVHLHHIPDVVQCVLCSVSCSKSRLDRQVIGVVKWASPLIIDKLTMPTTSPVGAAVDPDVPELPPSVFVKSPYL